MTIMIVVATILVLVPKTLVGFQVAFGDCPIYFEEPCRPHMVKFLLSVQTENATIYRYLNPFNPTLPEEFNPAIPLKIAVHGYGGIGLDFAMGNVTEAYRDVGYSVILVDWGPLASIPCYATAYLNTWHVGQCLAVLAVNLIPLGISPEFLHVVGFSLGAHIAGLAGDHVKKLLGTSFGRITGLDPALPFFATLKNDWKLDPSDARFVDVIHTSAGSFGKIEAEGHVDFYVNGGVLQPFCYDFPNPPICSHLMAGIYFAESIRGNRHFVGRECESIGNYYLGFCRNGKKAIMGEFANYRTYGIFFVETSNTPPFALDLLTYSRLRHEELPTHEPNYLIIGKVGSFALRGLMDDKTAIERTATHILISPPSAKEV